MSEIDVGDNATCDQRMAAFLALHLVSQVLDEAYIIANAAKESGQPYRYISILKNLRSGKLGDADEQYSFEANARHIAKINEDIVDSIMATSTPQKFIDDQMKLKEKAIGQGDGELEPVESNLNNTTSLLLDKLFDLSELEMSITPDFVIVPKDWEDSAIVCDTTNETLDPLIDRNAQVSKEVVNAGSNISDDENNIAITLGEDIIISDEKENSFNNGKDVVAIRTEEIIAAYKESQNNKNNNYVVNYIDGTSFEDKNKYYNKNNDVITANVIILDTQNVSDDENDSVIICSDDEVLFDTDEMPYLYGSTIESSKDDIDTVAVKTKAIIDAYLSKLGTYDDKNKSALNCSDDDKVYCNENVIVENNDGTDSCIANDESVCVEKIDTKQNIDNKSQDNGDKFKELELEGVEKQDISMYGKLYSTINRDYEQCSEEEVESALQDLNDLSMHDVELLSTVDTDGGMEEDVKEIKTVSTSAPTGKIKFKKSLFNRLRTRSSKFLVRVREWWQKRMPVKRMGSWDPDNNQRCPLSPATRERRSLSLRSYKHLCTPKSSNEALHSAAFKFNTINEAFVSSSDWKTFQENIA